MKIAIAGYGIEGKQNYTYFSQLTDDITILDERELTDTPEGAVVRTGAGSYDNLQEFDMVVRTAGLSPYKLKQAKKIWSATNEFFAQCPAPIIGITGTKGKGTTSSFIASILRAAGKTVHLVGNIGVPALSVLSDITADDVVVYEMSSFQLWDSVKSPHIAVVLMIEPDHLDVHTDMDDYIAAKSHICAYQTAQDVCIYHPSNPLTARVVAITAAQKQRYNAVDGGGVYIKDQSFWFGDRELCSTRAVRLPGAHNLDNACAAISAVLALQPVQPTVIAQGLMDFTGLPHRLKFVAEKQGVAFYDDSIATTPGSAIAAVRAFDQPKVLIMGGSYKGADFTPLATELLQHTMRHIVLIGQEARRIADTLQQAGVTNYTVLDETDGMAAAVSQAAAHAHKGDVVILSPACASFGMFKNYQDRGEQFIAAVEALT